MFQEMHRRIGKVEYILCEGAPSPFDKRQLADPRTNRLCHGLHRPRPVRTVRGQRRVRTIATAYCPRARTHARVRPQRSTGKIGDDCARLLCQAQFETGGNQGDASRSEEASRRRAAKSPLFGKGGIVVSLCSESPTSRYIYRESVESDYADKFHKRKG